MGYLLRKKQAAPELPAAQYPPVLVDPALAFPKVLGDLLEAHYVIPVIRFKRR
jgi:hypothetical protein